jgi:hypothetical protein
MKIVSFLWIPQKDLEDPQRCQYHTLRTIRQVICLWVCSRSEVVGARMSLQVCLTSMGPLSHFSTPIPPSLNLLGIKDCLSKMRVSESSDIFWVCLDDDSSGKLWFLGSHPPWESTASELQWTATVREHPKEWRKISRDLFPLHILLRRHFSRVVSPHPSLWHLFQPLIQLVSTQGWRIKMSQGPYSYWVL